MSGKPGIRSFGGIRPGHIIISVIAILLALVAVVFFGEPAVAPDAGRRAAEVPRIVIAPVRTATVEQSVEVVGQVEPWQRVELVPEVSGRVETVHVELGDRVGSGAPLVGLDPAPFEEAVRERRAALQRAVARLEETRDSRARLERLRERGMISEREYEAAVAQHRSAEADVAAAQAALERADRQLRDAVLRAPFSGTVVARNVERGDVVGPQRPVLTLADLDTVAVVAGLTETEVARLRRGQRARVRAGDATYAGTVAGFAESADPATGTYRARIRVDNRGRPRLLGGMTVRLSIPWGRLTDQLTVPATAIVYEQAVPYVFRLDGDRVRRLRVEPGARLDDRVAVRVIGRAGEGEEGAITGRETTTPQHEPAAPEPGPETPESEPGTPQPAGTGLSAGDWVVVVGQSQLDDGTRVEVTARRDEEATSAGRAGSEARGGASSEATSPATSGALPAGE